MIELSQVSFGASPSKNTFPRASESLKELRKLLVGQEQIDIGRLKERLENLEIYSQDIAQALPDAVRLRSAQDDQLAEALRPEVEKAILASAKEDPRALAEAITPALGPALRRSAGQSARRATRAVYRAVGDALSLRGWKWRFESWRTGRPYEEIAGRRNLVFRVEEIFLIHRATGRLLLNASAAPDATPATALPADVEALVRDRGGRMIVNERKEARVGELTVWTEPGEHAVLAAVIRGMPPAILRATFRQALEAVHEQCGAALELWQGEPFPFEAAAPGVADCFRSRYQRPAETEAPSRRGFIATWTLATLAVLGAAIGLFAWFQADAQWSGFVDRLRQQPGLVVIDEGARDGRPFVYGFRDPMAADPAVLAETAGLDPSFIRLQFEPFISSRPGYLLARARETLRPPDGVSLSIENGFVHAAGTAPAEWIAKARERAGSIAGASGYRDDALSAEK